MEKDKISYQTILNAVNYMRDMPVPSLEQAYRDYEDAIEYADYFVKKYNLKITKERLVFLILQNNLSVEDIQNIVAKGDYNG